MLTDVFRDATRASQTASAGVNASGEHRFTLPTEFLLTNSAAYERAVAKLPAPKGTDGAETLLRRVAEAAELAISFHPGRFVDGILENVALEVGSVLDQSDTRWFDRITEGQRTSQRRLLHVATHVNAVGGHTRMLLHWIRKDAESRHSIVVTNQQTTPVPSWISDTTKRSGGSFSVLSSQWTDIAKSIALRNTARRNADLVILHHDAGDLVPAVAFSTNDLPPVGIVNCSDHLFWLGASIQDVVINLRTIGAEHTRNRRFISANVVLPIPLDAPTGVITRKDARKALGLCERATVLVTVGRAEKFRPCGGRDFIATAGRILDAVNDAQWYVVGETEEGIRPYLRHTPHERLRFVGPIVDPSTYWTAADMYVETFPFGGQTALLEAALRGLPCVRAYAPLCPMLVANDDSIEDLCQPAADEQHFIEQVISFALAPSLRSETGEALRHGVAEDHIGDGWARKLAQVYHLTDRLTHQPAAIPRTSCLLTDEDIGLSLWHAMADGRHHTMGRPGEELVSILRHAAAVSKSAGDYSTARIHAGRALLHSLNDRASWRLFISTVAGPHTALLRNAG